MRASHSSKSSVNLHPLERWLSGFAGAVLTLSGLARGRCGWLRTASGILMLRRAFTGRSALYGVIGVNAAGSRSPAAGSLVIRTHASATVGLPRDKVFAFWARLENLPRFLRHLASIERIDDKRSHWTAHGPGSWQVEWDAEIVDILPGERISWRSVAGSDVECAGLARFHDAAGGLGTELRVELRYAARGSLVAAYMARMFGPQPEREVAEDLGRLKLYLETGQSAPGEPALSARQAARAASPA